jgi:hypothetical protein
MTRSRRFLAALVLLVTAAVLAAPAVLVAPAALLVDGPQDGWVTVDGFGSTEPSSE